MELGRSGVFSGTVTALATVATIFTRDADELFITFVVGVANLSAFDVAFRAHVNGGFGTVATVAGDYTTIGGVMVDASGNLVTAAFGATVYWLKLNVRGVESVRIQAAGTASTITGHFGMT